MSRLIPAHRLERAARRAKDPVFAAAMEALHDTTYRTMAVPLMPPGEPAGFYHDYFCPEHAVELRFDGPGKHRCPVDGKILEGEPFDSASRWFVNNRLSQGVLAFSLRHRIEDHPPSLQGARNVLTAYADRYSRYPVGKDAGYGRGRATFQSLDEAAWLIPLAIGYDLVRDELTGKERHHIESDLLKPAADHILGEKYDRIHNIECWHNAALVAVGVCLDDERLLARAIDAPFGFHHQLAEGVRDDGLWWEGSASYHFYALYALTSLAQMVEASGLELNQDECLKKMFEAPLQMADPQGNLPAFNDCWFFSSLVGDVCHGVPAAPAFYETAFGWYGDPGLGEVASRSSGGRKRGSLDALLYGADDLPAEVDSERSSILLEPSGLALGRTKDCTGRPLELGFKFGPHGGNHGHPDKLSMTLHIGNEAVSPDLGTPGYGIDLHRSWYKTTLSHNTFTVDGRSQPESEGELTTWRADDSEGEVAARVVFTEDPYDGVSAERRIFWSAEGYVVDVTDVECGRPRQIDWVFRIRGSNPMLRGFSPTEPGALEGDGYAHVRESLWWVPEADANRRIDWTLNEGGITLAIPATVQETVIVGAVPFSPASKQSDILIRRRNASEARFITVFYPWRDPDPEVSVHLDGNQVEVRTASGGRQWDIAP